MTRQQYFDQLLEMFEQHIEATHYPDEYNIQENILSFIEKTPVPEEDGDGYDPYEGDGKFASNH